MSVILMILSAAASIVLILSDSLRSRLTGLFRHDKKDKLPEHNRHTKADDNSTVTHVRNFFNKPRR